MSKNLIVVIFFLSVFGFSYLNEHPNFFNNSVNSVSHALTPNKGKAVCFTFNDKITYDDAVITYASAKGEYTDYFNSENAKEWAINYKQEYHFTCEVVRDPK